MQLVGQLRAIKRNLVKFRILIPALLIVIFTYKYHDNFTYESWTSLLERSNLYSEEASYAMEDDPYNEIVKLEDENGNVIIQNKTQEAIDEDRINSHSSKKHLWKKYFPKALIIGVQKAGTEALKDFLDLNDKIRIPDTEEVHFFDVYSNYKKGKSWYRQKMPKSWPDDIVIEKSPNYFNRPLVPRRIKAFNPDIKLIAILRNPSSRAVSNYVHNKESGRDKGSFKEAVMKGRTLNPKSTYVNKGLYYEHLSRWYKYFPKENILLLDGDAFVKNPVPILNKVEDFLGIKRKISKANVVYAKWKGFYCKRKKGHTICQGKKKGRQHPKIPDSLKHLMKDFYRPHNKKLYELTGLNFTGIKL